jgi:hypothetical protein
MADELKEFLVSIQKLSGLSLSKDELDVFLQGAKENYRVLIGLEDVLALDEDEPNSYLNLIALRSKRKLKRK